MRNRIGLFSICFLIATTAMSQTFNTTTSDDLHTWYHPEYDDNATGSIDNEKVRRSKFYHVQVSENDVDWYDAFCYMSIPRSGRAKAGYSTEDGAEFSSNNALSMSWSSFLYGKDVTVAITLREGVKVSSIEDIIVRPRAFDMEVTIVNDSTVHLQVPYAADGFRFSVEFDAHQVDVYNDQQGGTGNLNLNNTGAFVHREPQNALLLFAEPTPHEPVQNGLIPDTSTMTVHLPDTGLIDNLDNIQSEVIWFKPGLYYMPWNYHAQFSEHVKWIYLEPGAYVKGAFEFIHDNQPEYRITGYGVLSGENYVYEADKTNGYLHKDPSNQFCHSTCVKMMQFKSSDQQQQLKIHGITINEPPYHSFVVYGNESAFQMDVDHYKQVGSWYWQTDGIELYEGSNMANTFFHANDDVLKIYHGDVNIDNTVIWKNENGPVIQWGWTPRDFSNVNVSNTFVIHNRMYWNDHKYNTCVLNSSSHWQDMSLTNVADVSQHIKDVMFDGIYVEGAVNCAMRIYALSNMEHFTIKNLHVDEYNDLDLNARQSNLKAYTNSQGEKVKISDQKNDGDGLKIINHKVGDEYIAIESSNWEMHQLGALNFDAEEWNNWDAWVDSSLIVGMIPLDDFFSTPKGVMGNQHAVIFMQGLQPLNCGDCVLYSLSGQRIAPSQLIPGRRYILINSQQ